MFYRIEYGPAMPPKKDRLPFRLMALTCIFFALFILGVKAAWPGGYDKLTQLLFPLGNRSQFLDAVQSFFSQLQDGAPFYASLTAFCRQVISYAELPPV